MIKQLLQTTACAIMVAGQLFASDGAAGPSPEDAAKFARVREAAAAAHPDDNYAYKLDPAALVAAVEPGGALDTAEPHWAEHFRKTLVGTGSEGSHGVVRPVFAEALTAEKETRGDYWRYNERALVSEVKDRFRIPEAEFPPEGVEPHAHPATVAACAETFGAHYDAWRERKGPFAYVAVRDLLNSVLGVCRSGMDSGPELAEADKPEGYDSWDPMTRQDFTRPDYARVARILIEAGAVRDLRFELGAYNPTTLLRDCIAERFPDGNVRLAVGVGRQMSYGQSTHYCGLKTLPTEGLCGVTPYRTPDNVIDINANSGHEATILGSFGIESMPWLPEPTPFSPGVIDALADGSVAELWLDVSLGADTVAAFMPKLEVGGVVRVLRYSSEVMPGSFEDHMAETVDRMLAHLSEEERGAQRAEYEEMERNAWSYLLGNGLVARNITPALPGEALAKLPRPVWSINFTRDGAPVPAESHLEF